jgi:hypothetical protein
MADRRNRPPAKRADEILDDLIAGHNEALYESPLKGMRYLQNFLAKYDSIPNAVKFYVYDLLAEDAYEAGEPEVCRDAAEHAGTYLAYAREENAHRVKQYLPTARYIERGISVLVDEGEFPAALTLCDQAVEMGLGKAYAAKRASIERMM